MSELTREQLLTAIITGKGPAYLRGVDLSMLDLSNAGWLTEADLSNANLSNTNLSRANLKNAKLENCNLSAANLSSANLEGADLRRAKLSVTNLKMAKLRGANLQSARLVGAILVRANLEGANLEDADLEGANLERADLRNAKLNLANLKMANLQHVILQGASLLGTILDQNSNGSNLTVPSCGFAGSINYVQLIDLVQFLCLSRSNLLVRIQSEHGNGTIHVRSGRVYHAQTDTLKGEEAFFKMVHWENGLFETFPLPEDGVASIDKPVEHLLLESMRQHDERESDGMKKEHRELLKEIERHLPILVRPSKELIDLISKEGRQINGDKELKISDAFNSKDTGEILCSIYTDEGIFIAPLSYIRLRPDHALAKKISAYQHDMRQRV